MYHWFRHVTAAACYRFEEGMGVDEAIICLVPKVRKDPQLQLQHVLVVKTAFRQMLEVIFKRQPHVCLPAGNQHKHKVLMLVAPSPAGVLIRGSKVLPEKIGKRS